MPVIQNENRTNQLNDVFSQLFCNLFYSSAELFPGTASWDQSAQRELRS